MPEQHPVTAALEAEVVGELRRRGIVVWLDRDGHYQEYVDRAAVRHRDGVFPYPVFGFHGSFLDLMLQLEDFEAGLDPTPLLIHMPGFTEESIRATPVLELYKVGYRYRRALDTLIRETATGKVAPADIDAFLAGDDLTLASADEWLAGRCQQPRQGIAGLLERTSLEVVIRELLVKDTFLGDQLDSSRPEDTGALRAYLGRKVGLDDRWLAFVSPASSQASPFDVLVDALASWLLCVEYVADLTRAPYLADLQPLAKLPKKTIALCREHVAILRDQHPAEYEILADQVETHLSEELPRIRPEDLGRIDTFRGEEARILEAAIDALKGDEWSKAGGWADARTGVRSFWLGQDQLRRMAWDLVTDAARCGCLLEEHARPFAGVTGFDDALERYTSAAYLVDQAHRRFEQRRASRLQPQLPHFADFKEVVARLRAAYRIWADHLASDFSALCRSKGLLPDLSLLQRSFFEQDVLPLTENGKQVAVFLVDGLRYEMASELAEDFEEPGATVGLSARYAELPTVTAVGMNALAPVCRDGRLRLAGTAGFKGFSTGEFVVNGPDDRARAMGLRCGRERALSLTLAEVCESSSETLRKRLAQKSLIVVHGREIDEAGEAGVGLAAFESGLAQIRAAWLHLKALGVSRFVISSDHGFLLQDETTKVRPYGKKTDPSRRFVLADERRLETGLVTASLSELGYDGRDGFVLFTGDTSVFDGPGSMAGFTHGGNSPQERIVPVLTFDGARALNVDLGAYLVEAEPASDALGYRRLRVRLRLDRGRSAALPFPRSEPIDLAIRAVGRNDVRVMIVGATGSLSEKRGRIRAPVGEEWSEVFFTLHAPREDRVRVEVFHPDGVEKVTACMLEGWFRVEADVAGAVEAPSAAPESCDDWGAALPDEATRRIFEQINQHGVITEAEAVTMLGSPRAFRRFSAKFEELRALTPLEVRIEVTPAGKRYVREGRGM